MIEEKAIILSQDQLNESLIYWQDKLRLNDWIIELKLKRARDMREDCAGSVNWVLSKKMAIIHILEAIDYPDDVMGVQDMENTLVHELLHLHFASINDVFGNNSDIYEIFEEQAINSIADGLLKIYRGG